MSEIETAAGYKILVDDEDSELVKLFNWLVELQGRRTKKPRVYTQIGGRKRKTKVYLSRMLLREPSVTVDHVNGDTLDNRRENLRLATQKQNSCNRIKHQEVTSKFKGVSLHRNRHGKRPKVRPWAACIVVDGQHRRLGFFSDETEAAKAYDVEARKLFGEFASLNFAGGCRATE